MQKNKRLRVFAGPNGSGKAPYSMSLKRTTIPAIL